MPELNVETLRKQLLDSGVAPKHVLRVVSEISDHLDDLEDEALRHGRAGEEAKADALDRFGDTNIIAEHVLSRPELKSWIYRYPQIARLTLPIAYCLALPAVPILAGIANGSAVGRWCAGLIASGLVTSGMLLLLQVAIKFS